MSIWNNKTIPFWQNIERFPNKFTIIGFLNTDPRSNWPESFKPSMSDIIYRLNVSQTSYIKVKDEGEVFFVNLLSGKIIVSCTLFKDKNELILNKKNGLQYATNYLKTGFIKDGIKIEHKGIEIFDGKRDFYDMYDEDHNESLSRDIKNLISKIKQVKITKKDDLEENGDEDEFSESESSKVEEILETLEAYVNKEYEIEDAKARAEKPFVYTEFKAEDIASTYKYYYRITLLKEDIKRLRELSPSMLQIKKTDETFMDLEVFNIKPDNSPNDIVVTTSFQTDRSMIDSSNELYLVAIPTLQKVRQKVIDDLRGKVSPNKWLVPLAAGVYKFKKTIKQSVPEYNKERPLLPAQKDGVDKGAGSEDITLVLGPPGTGKTTVILSWVKYFVAQGKKVLVTSQSNMAVDNVLIRLDEEKEFECLRVGNESKVMREAHGLLLENYAREAQKKLIEGLSTNIEEIINLKSFLNSLSDFANEIDLYINLEIKQEKLINQIEDLINIDSKLERYKNSNRFIKLFKWFNYKRDLKNRDFLQNQISIEIKNKNLINVLNNEKSKLILLKKDKPNLPTFIDSIILDCQKYQNLFDNLSSLDQNLLKESIDTDSTFINSLYSILNTLRESIETERQSSLYETILDYVDVVGATCIGINSNKQFANIPFDVVIVDESGQIQLHNLMVPLSRASKAILVGDHKQLPPVVDDELAAELEEQGFDSIFLQKSWFEILWDPMPQDHKTMLDTQFRCPAIISDFVSKAFYESKYFAGSGMEKKQPILPYFNSTMTFIDTSKVFPSFEQSRITDGRTEVLGNEVETTIIIKTLMNFIKELPYLAEKNEIGIIVPYKNHVLEVKRTIKKLKLDIGNLNVEDLVASVDSYQGQERDVIIFAFSRSNKGGNIGFLADWRRLNVAMTRTKKQLIMVGSLKTLTMDNQKEHEAEFKQAMRILESELRAKDSIIDGRKFVSGAKK